MAAAAMLSFAALSTTAHAADTYGPPGLQANSIGSGNAAESTFAVSADFNNDGYPDIAVINTNTSTLSIFTSNAIGSLTLSHYYGVFNLASPRGIKAGDMNGDGKIDLVVSDTLGVSVLLGTGDPSATFSAASPQRPSLPNAESTSVVMLADINHDGKLDIVAGVSDSGGIADAADYYYDVLINMGGAKFIAVAQYEVDTVNENTVLAKIDGDAEFDIAYTIGDSVWWLKGNGGGNFQAAAKLIDLSNGINYVDAMKAVDLDGDGKTDLVMQDASGGGIWFAKGNGNGSFQPQVRLYNTGIPSNGGRGMGQPAIADVNGDGRLDVVSDGYVLLQQANHSFVFNQHIGYSQTHMLTSLDLNGDGRADMIAAGPGAGKIAIFLTLTGSPNKLIVSGGPQSTVFNTAFAKPLTIKVLDANNFGIKNLHIIISSPSGVAIPNSGGFSGLTDAQGMVSYTPIANGVLGCYTVYASVENYNAGAAMPAFELCHTGANDLTVTPASDNQSTLVSTAFGSSLQVRLTDPSNNPKSGVTVTFGVPKSGPRAILSAATAVTDVNGFASVTATASAMSGSYNVSVSAPGATPTSIKLTNAAAPGSAAAIFISGHTYAYVTKAFGSPLTVTVQDFGGNPVAGETVLVKVIPAGAATATFSSLSGVSNALGQVEFPATANGLVGQYAVKVSVQGSLLASPQTVQRYNIAEIPKFITLAGGTPQSTPVNTTFSQKLRVKVTAWDGAVTPQVKVYFVATGGAKLSAVSALADANGFAEVTATADSTVGTYQVSAIVYDTVLEAPIVQTFDLTNVGAAVSNMQSIPTLSEYGVMLLGMLMASIGAFWHRRRQM